jgi:GTP-binding protein
LRIEATFITSGAGAADFPGDGLPEVALVGRSNVGKSSLINASVRQKIARTSAAPGKTRLANIYRVARGGGRPLYLVDLPGYGYARGGNEAARGFDQLMQAFFSRGIRLQPDRQHGPAGSVRRKPDATEGPAALLLVDSRHPGLESDLEAWRWLQSTVERRGIVATKIDKLSRAERQRAIRQLEAVFEYPVLPVSAVTGEGLDELWILIDRMANNSNRPNRQEPPRRSPRPQPGATAARPPKK